ncbi:sodium-dependent transporter [Pseudoramibacter faecis]|uniref:sodium-dependent transporter n=1 Tax=Pseudoramibacter faecis TaxID=3108534 RepID=UPI002E77957D|nr:sodium-dependent transporter [Pseudoramibacter sp. HA2172]
MEREKFSTRLGFILISAGCAIGLGNVWRFPYITGRYGGGAFVLIYLFFLFFLGMPVVIAEFAVGRASQKSVARSFDVLEPEGSRWHLFKWFAMAGNYLLMMYYTTISGWVMLYFFKTARGDFAGLSSRGVAAAFGAATASPLLSVLFMALMIVLGFGICAGGLQNGVENIVKVIMICLLALMMVLAVNSLLLPGTKEGLSFYLKPNFNNLTRHGLSQAIFAAMGQSLFTLGVGIGSMAIFGSYIDKQKRLAGEALNIAVLDTVVALLAGIIIFPACFSYGIAPTSGPPLLFITLPNVFNHMPHRRLWGALFFLFMTFAAVSTVVAVFQNIVANFRDMTGWPLKKTCALHAALLILLSLPCALGFNLLSFVHPLGAGSTILDLEDFIQSNNVVFLGSIVYVVFVTSRYGWGYDGFLEEVNTGIGLRFPRAGRIYMTIVLPLLIFSIFLWGYLG